MKYRIGSKGWRVLEVIEKGNCIPCRCFLSTAPGMQRGAGMNTFWSTLRTSALIKQQQLGMRVPGQQASFTEQYKRAIDQQIGPQVKQGMRQAMIGQLQKDWPPSLGPSASATVAYRATRAGLRLEIGIEFQDEASYLWQRVNADQPTRIERAGWPTSAMTDRPTFPPNKHRIKMS